MQRTFGRFGLVGALLVVTGCMTDIAASSTIRVIHAASPALGRYRDIELAEATIPSGIGTMEGVLIVKPESDVLHESLARAYSSLAFGFIMDHMEEAERSDDESAQVEVEAYRARATAAFLRAKELGLEMLTIWEDDDGGAEGAMGRGIDAWTAYLQEFDDEEQAGMLFWTAYAWANYIGINRSDMTAVSDLPFVVALVERVLALDGSVQSWAPHALRAGLIGGTPQQMGGRPAEARQLFELAIRNTERHNFMYLTMEARIVAVALQDRALYQRLLEEVIAGDVNVVTDWRLSNLIAQRRARRYLAQIDEFFPPVEGGTPDADPAAEPEAPAAAPAAGAHR